MRLNGRTSYFAREKLRQLSFRRQQINKAIEALEQLESQPILAATELACSRMRKVPGVGYGNVVPIRGTQRSI
jgi:hypothetical protein